MRSVYLSVLTASLFPLGAMTPHAASLDPAGLTYTFTVHQSRIGADGNTVDRVGLSGHAAVLGDRTRIYFDAAAAPPALGTRGAYILEVDGGARIIVISPASRQYVEMPPQALIELFNHPSRRFGNLDNQATDVLIGERDMGAGPVMFGQPTEHYQLMEAKTINGQLPDASGKLRDSVVTDLFYAPGLKNFVNPFLAEPELSGGLDGLGPEDRRRLSDARGKMYRDVAPLRAVSTTTVTDPSGRTTSSVLTTEVSNLRATDVDPSIFDIPAGYSKRTIPGHP